MEVYEPDVAFGFEKQSRGGISSRLVIDSDWSARGGNEKYRD